MYSVSPGGRYGFITGLNNMKHMEFSLAEKLAVIRAIEDVIVADRRVDGREVSFMKQLSYFLNFDMSLIGEARKLNRQEGMLILSGMAANKKQSLGLILKEMAGADGRVNDDELTVIYGIFADAGIKV